MTQLSTCLDTVPQPSVMTCLSKMPQPSACLDKVPRSSAFLDKVLQPRVMPRNGASA